MVCLSVLPLFICMKVLCYKITFPILGLTLITLGVRDIKTEMKEFSIIIMILIFLCSDFFYFYFLFIFFFFFFFFIIQIILTFLCSESGVPSTHPRRRYKPGVTTAGIHTICAHHATTGLCAQILWRTQGSKHQTTQQSGVTTPLQFYRTW